MEPWLSSMIMAEIIFVAVPALVGTLVIFLRERRNRRPERAAATMGIITSAVFLTLKLMDFFWNTGTIVCVSQSFVTDQMGAVALGFLRYAVVRWRDKNSLTRVILLNLLFACVLFLVVSIAGYVRSLSSG